MAEFTEVMKRKERMCDAFLCDKCPLNKYKNYNSNTCANFIIDEPQQAEEIIMKWAKEHPIKTNADKFKEVFGFTPNIDICPFCSLGDGFSSLCCIECRYRYFWMQEYKESSEV